MLQTAENVAQHMAVSRQEQDEFAALSQQRAEAAQKSGHFAEEITPVTTPSGKVVDTDDCPRHGTTAEKLAGLKPVLAEQMGDKATVTAGNACPLNDGAAAVIVMSDTRAKELGLTPLARFVSSGVSSLNPEVMGLGPIEATKQALGRAGLTIKDIDLVEINEAFAAQVVPSARELGIPSNSLPKAFEVIEKGLIREVDLFSANGAPFVQMAGVGFDAKVIEETTLESKKMLGPLAYLVAAVKVLGETPPKVEVVTAEGRRETGVAVLCGNGSLYGGQFRLFRKANNTDSMLDVIVFKEAGYRFVLDSLSGIARGGIDLADSTAYFQSSAITVTSDREVPVEIDGEWLGRFKEVTFGETSSRLRVLAPEKPCGTPFMDTMRSLLQWPTKSSEQPVPDTH